MSPFVLENSVSRDGFDRPVPRQLYGHHSHRVIADYRSIGYKVANSARGQLKGDDKYVPVSPFAPENLVTRDGFGIAVPRQPSYSPHTHSG